LLERPHGSGNSPRKRPAALTQQAAIVKSLDPHSAKQLETALQRQ